MDPIAKLAGAPTDLMQGESRLHGRTYHVKSWHRWPDARKVRTIRRLAKEYGADPEMRFFTARVLREGGAAPRDYAAQAAVLLKYVQNTIYYTNEVNEQLQSPWRTLKERTGDCFAAGTLVLRDDFELVPVDDVRAGDRIWGFDKWSTVEAWADKGDLSVWEIDLNNGSTLRLTGDHKLWVKSCERHGPACKDLTSTCRNCTRAGRTFTWEVCRVSDVQPGWTLKQPAGITPGSVEDDHDLAWLDGVYVADGWSETSKCCISGMDGKPKEAQKRRVVSIVGRYGGSTHWQRKYVAIHAGPLADRLKRHGSTAQTKRLVGLDRTVRALYAYDEGLQADASRNTHGAGWTFGTINRQIAVQYRVLQRILGRSTSWRCVTDHGGFGKNPIYRVGVRQPAEVAEKPLRIKAIRKDVEVQKCFDIQTDDKHVYLPEADCTVHNCDDMLILLATMAESVALPWRIALGGYKQVPPPNTPEVQQLRANLRNPNPQVAASAKARLEALGRKRVRWIEGQPWPRGARFVHIYAMIGWPPFSPQKWASAEPTVRGLPLGHDVVLHGIPEGFNSGADLAGWSGAVRGSDDGRSVSLPIKKFAGWSSGTSFGGMGDPQVIQAEVVDDAEVMGGTVVLPGDGWVATAVNNIDWPGLLNSVIQGTITAIAIGWATTRLGRSK